MPLFQYHCEACGATRKHFISTASNSAAPRCACGESDRYKRKIGNFQSQVNYKTIEEIMEHEIDPYVENKWLAMGRDIVNGDVKTMENVFGEAKMKETFYESDTWVDEDGVD